MANALFRAALLEATICSVLIMCISRNVKVEKMLLCGNA
jgi:hypothetical protein